MRTYELTFIVDAQLSPEKQEEVISNFLDLLKNQGVEIISMQKWGKRKLAYMINGHQYGQYVMTQFKAKADHIPQIERHLKLSSNIIRHLILHRDPKTLKLMQAETERLAREAMLSSEPSHAVPKEQPTQSEETDLKKPVDDVPEQHIDEEGQNKDSEPDEKE